MNEGDRKLKPSGPRWNWMLGNMLHSDAWIISRGKARSLTEKIACRRQARVGKNIYGLEGIIRKQV